MIELPIVPRLALILLKSGDQSPIVRHFLIHAAAVASTTVHFFHPSTASRPNQNFCVRGSDYSSHAKFIYAFARSKKRRKLCKNSGVPYVVANDAFMLSMQLHRILGVDPQPSDKFGQKQEIAFRKALCVGFLDSVARKVPSSVFDSSKALYEHGGKFFRPHPWSQCTRPFPEWILFSSIESIVSKKDRICGLTAVEIEWLFEAGYQGFLQGSDES